MARRRPGRIESSPVRRSTREHTRTAAVLARTHCAAYAVEPSPVAVVGIAGLRRSAGAVGRQAVAARKLLSAESDTRAVEGASTPVQLAGLRSSASPEFCDALAASKVAGASRNAVGAKRASAAVQETALGRSAGVTGGPAFATGEVSRAVRGAVRPELAVAAEAVAGLWVSAPEKICQYYIGHAVEKDTYVACVGRQRQPTKLPVQYAEPSVAYAPEQPFRSHDCGFPQVT